ncbi:hypothetical protein LPJ60_000802 [Coemansia sp. RSA 2675]|nr:hypothetical protein LPJ60_000802 [Coemansia sp. RSA 2675]
MCSNIDCTWPFECQDMDRCFEHDATVPSMRKRAKKRKALASKEEKRHKRVTLGPLGSASRPSLEVLPPSSAQPALGLLSEDLDWLTDLCQQPSAASSTSANTSSGTPLRTTGHSELFMSQADLLAAFGSAPNTESSLRAPDTSFMSAFTSGDAVIPRTSRHPSPATSNNSESGHDDLAMLIGGNGDIAKMFSTQPQSSALDPLSLLLSSPPNSAPVAGSTSTVGSIGAIGLLDHYYWSNSQSSAALPISALSSVVPASSIGAKQKLSNTTAAPLDHDIPFDFGQLFSSPPPSATLPPTTDLGAAVQSINADTLIENILGSPTTGCI